MSSFTPRSWKSRIAPRADHSAEPPSGKFRAYRYGKSNNLPIPSTTLIGRERDVAEGKALLERHRLVTLVGSGGVGKTRLAIQIGTELLKGYPDGVWFVDLAPIADPELVSSVLAQTLGISQQQGRPVDESTLPWLERKQLLLIFDNCEHVVETIALLASAILRAAPNVRILATSRQTLSIGGEAPLRIPSLDVPHAVSDLSVSGATEFAAVALFVARARTADRSFALTEQTAPIVVDICRRLDGVPLAIELAAARVRILSIPHLAERLNERFSLLTGGSRDALPRQKTLHALLDWSYDLLTKQEQLLFARIGIFAGGFALDAATSVCCGDQIDEPDILDLIASLTDKSLVVADTSGIHERYRLLESTDAYAVEKLRASGEGDAMARRHAEYFQAHAMADDENHYRNGLTQAWLDGRELELDNYRSALTWALTKGNDAVVGAEIAGALLGLWTNAGLVVEGHYWLDRAIEAVSEVEKPDVAARLWIALSGLFYGKRSHDAAERAMQLYAATGDASGVAYSQQSVASALFQMGEFDAAYAAIVPALAAAHARGDTFTVAIALNTQAIIEQARGNHSLARDGFTQALVAQKELGDEAATARVLGNLAELEFADGHPEQALRANSEALQIHRRGRNAIFFATYSINGAAYRLAIGDLTGCRESALEGLSVARQGQIDFCIVVALQHLALLAVLSGDGRRGALLLGYVETRYAELDMKRASTEQWGYEKLLGALRETLSEDELAPLLAEGATWSEDRAVEEALQV